MIQRITLVICVASLALHVGQAVTRVPQPCRPPMVREVPHGRIVF